METLVIVTLIVLCLIPVFFFLGYYSRRIKMERVPSYHGELTGSSPIGKGEEITDNFDLCLKCGGKLVSSGKFNRTDIFTCMNCANLFQEIDGEYYEVFGHPPLEEDDEKVECV